MSKKRKITLTESQIMDVIDIVMAANKIGGKMSGKLNEKTIFDQFKFLGEAEDDADESSAEEAKESRIEKVTMQTVNTDALKYGVKFSKLMNNVTADDMVVVSGGISMFLTDYVVDGNFDPKKIDDILAKVKDNSPNSEVVDDTEKKDEESSEQEEPELDETPEEFEIDMDDEEEEPAAEPADETMMEVPEEFII